MGGAEGVGGGAAQRSEGLTSPQGDKGTCSFKGLQLGPPFSPGTPSLMGEADPERIIVTVTKLPYGMELVYAKCLEQAQHVVDAIRVLVVIITLNSALTRC